VLFGSGYVLLAFLRADLVDHRHWLTESQLLDAVAVGQVTPGQSLPPQRSSATCFTGAPAPCWRHSVSSCPRSFSWQSPAASPAPAALAHAGAFLDGVNVASLALIATVVWHLGRSALTDVLTVAIAGLSALLLLKFRLNSAWLVLAGALVGIGRWWLQ